MNDIEYIVVMPRVEGDLESGYRTNYYSDMKRFQKLLQVIHHGATELDQADDFLIGEVSGTTLLGLQWMNERRDDLDERVAVALSLGLNVVGGKK